MIGLSEDSQQTELTITDETSATIYKVVSQTVDLEALRAELESLETQMDEPTDEELIAIGKSMHPYYMQPDNSARIAEIKQILGTT